MMNLLNKGISAVLLAGLMVGCGTDEIDVTPTPSGISQVVLSSFEAVIEGDGTLVTITPLSIGADSYEVDFGDETTTDDVLTISEQGGSVTYDYPNELETVEYTITVTGKSEGKDDSETKTEVLEITHTPTVLTSVATSPTVDNANVLSIYSDGTESDGDLTSYTTTASNVDLDAGTAQYIAAEVGDAPNNAVQYSKLSSTIATISFDEIIVADAFATGESADSLHIDLHSIDTLGIDKVKISLGGKSFEQDLVSDEWTAFDIDLSDEGITSISDITFETGTNGTATDEATLNIDNIYLHRVSLSVPGFSVDSNSGDYSVTFTNSSELAVSYSWDFGDGSDVSTDESPTHEYTNDGEEATYTVTLTTTNQTGVSTSTTMDVFVGVQVIIPEVVEGDFESGGDTTRGPWSFVTTSGNSNPFGTSSDGSCNTYDGTASGAKTAGAKWSSSQSAADTDGTVVSGNTRYAYQAFTVTPNTEYVLEYEYAIRDNASGGSMVASILNGHFDSSDDAVASIPLVREIGTIANGKFADDSCTGGTTVKVPFRSNATGQISIMFYAVTTADAYIDNVKITLAE